MEHPALPPVSRSYSGAWGRSVTHYSPVRHSHPGSKLPGIPFDLHVLSTPPAFILSQNRTLHKKTFMESQQTALKKKKDGPSLKERTVTQKPRHPSNPLGYHTGGHRTGNQEPQATPTRMRPMASSTVHTIEFSNHQTQPANTPGTNPSRSPTGSKMNNLHEPQPKRKPTPTTHPQNPTNTTHPPACRNHATPTSYNSTHSPQPH